MKINIGDKIYIQKKDICLICKSTSSKNIPKSIIESYENNTELDELDFIEFDNRNDINFLNCFDFVIDYSDFKDFTELEIIKYRENDLNKMWRKKREYEPKLIDNNKVYDNVLDMIIEKSIYHFPSRDEAKRYPLDFQLLHNKIFDFDSLRHYFNNAMDLNLPDNVTKPPRYSKKQLQKIYNEVLCGELSFEELKPIEKPLYSIFSRMSYSPEISNIIKLIFQINENNTIDYINDDLLVLFLYLDNKKSKFDESSMYIGDYLYAVGFNKFDNFDSRTSLELSLMRLKNGIRNMFYSNPDNHFIREMSEYNYILSEILTILKNSDFSKSGNNIQFIIDMFLNMLVYVYFKPDVIDSKFDFMKDVAEYLNQNSEQLINLMGSDIDSKKFTGIDNDFLDKFTNANKLLLSLYNEKYNNTCYEKLSD